MLVGEVECLTKTLKEYKGQVKSVEDELGRVKCEKSKENNTFLEKMDKLKQELYEKQLNDVKKMSESNKMIPEMQRKVDDLQRKVDDLQRNAGELQKENTSLKDNIRQLQDIYDGDLKIAHQEIAD